MPVPQRPVVLVPGFAGTELIAKPVRPECPQEEVRCMGQCDGLTVGIFFHGVSMIM